MFRRVRAAASAALLFLLLADAASAQDVNLRSLDGSIEFEGTLLGFDGEFYRVETPFGPLTVAADGVSCAGPGCPDLENYIAEARFAGAPVIADTLLPALIESFARDRGMEVAREVTGEGATVLSLTRQSDATTAARFEIMASSSENGFAALREGRADLALALREPSARERADASAAGDDSLARRARVIGLDALVPIVSGTNPLRRIGLQDLAAVYSGEIVNWADLGGPDAPIALHLPARGSGLSQLFAARVLVPAEAGISPGVTRHDELRALSDAVARDPYAIGITTHSVVGNASPLALSGACGFVQHARPGTIKSEDFPLSAPLFIYPARQRQPLLVRDFLRFLESRAAERVVRRSGFVNQAVIRTGVEAQGLRLVNAIATAGEEISLAQLQEMARDMAGSERLSSTFRFAGGQTDLDAQSASAVSRLSRSIERGEFDGRRLVFVGFSDGEGDAEANRALSERRAVAVRRAVLQAAAAADPRRIETAIAAYGEAMPMACDDTDWGRNVNRRVEVWLQ